MPVHLTCPACGRSFPVKPSHARVRIYCSVPCATAIKRARIGPSSPAWRGGLASVDSGGYLVRTAPGGGTARVHRLVWEEAHGPIPRGYQVHHINGSKTDNRLENLTLLTHAEHSRLHQRRTLTEEDVRAMRARYAAGGTSQALLGREYGVNKATIHRILRHEKWRHVT